MSAVNGHFQILLGNDATYLRLFPPTGGGEPIRVDEMRDYLVSKGFNIDVVMLNAAVHKITRPADLKIANKKTLPCSESMSVTISPDKMTATCRFYPPSTQGSSMTKGDIISDLNFNGIKMGIDEREIDHFLKHRHYCRDYVLARGTMPTLGSDAKIEYFFNTDHNARPRQNEDGTVDFFHLDIISKCVKGDLLARLTREVKGEAGFNIVGDKLLPREVKRLNLRYNRHCELSEDGLSLTAKCNGHVSLIDSQVFVRDIYEVVDVDTSTGDIEYQGNILVTGNVKAGFTVKAEGDVEVRGVVEGATIEATGDVIIARGMNGMSRGVIKAGGNVIAKFFENTTVTAEGYIRSESVLHSKLSAKGDIEINGKHGFITGGIVRSRGTVSAKTIGTELGVSTEIEVGADPSIKIKSKSLEQEIAKEQKQITQVEPILATLTKRLKSGDKLTVDQIRYFKQLSGEYKELKQHLQQDNDEYVSLLDEIEHTKVESVIKVSQIAYPGTKLTIGDISLTLTTQTSHSRFVKEAGEIRVKAL